MIKKNVYQIYNLTRLAFLQDKGDMFMLKIIRALRRREHSFMQRIFEKKICFCLIDNCFQSLNLSKSNGSGKTRLTRREVASGTCLAHILKQKNKSNVCFLFQLISWRSLSFIKVFVRAIFTYVDKELVSRATIFTNQRNVNSGKFKKALIVKDQLWSRLV